jgi:hypothetical protein
LPEHGVVGPGLVVGRLIRSDLTFSGGDLTFFQLFYKDGY